MEQLIFALSPFLVSFLANGTKKLKTIRLSGYKKSIVRFIVALLSFGAVIGTTMISGADIEIASLETIVSAFLTFLSASGIYFISKKRDN